MIDKSKRFNSKIADTARIFIGKHIRQRRTELGCTQQELATMANIQRNTVAKLEQGLPYEFNSLIAVLGCLRGELQLVWHSIDSMPHFGTPTSN